MRQTVCVLFAAVLFAAPIAAQQDTPAAEQQAASTPAAQAPRAQTPAPSGQQAAAGQQAPAVHTPDPRVDQSDANIQLTVRIDDKGGPTPSTKTVALLVSNMGSSKVRSSGASRMSSMQLDVDAYAELRKSGLIRVNLTLYYQPEPAADEQSSKLNYVNESISLFMKDGAPTVITQAADPTKGSRGVTVEVTASIVK